MNTIALNHPLDVKLTEGLIKDTAASAFRHRMFGSAAILGGGAVMTLALGDAVAMGLYAYNHHTATADEIKAAMASLPPIKGEVTVKEGGKVEVVDGGEVAIKDGGTVTATGTVKLDTSSINVSEFMRQGPPAKDADGNVIQQEVTVFWIVPYNQGDVVTGWDYASGNATTPTRKFCHFRSSNQSADGSYKITPLADMTGAGTVTVAPTVNDYSAALSKCRWS